MTTKMEQLQADINIVMEGRSQEARMPAASKSRESVKEHDMLYQCYSWLIGTRRSNVECKAARLCRSTSCLTARPI